MNITEAVDLDIISGQDSPIHNMEGRIKLIITLLIIVYCVASNQILGPIVMETFLLVAMYIANLSFKTCFKRIILLLPFAGAIIVFQPFVHPGNVLWQSPISWIHITDIGLNWTIMLSLRLIVCLTAIVLLSSTSPMQEIVQSLRKLGMPRDIAMILSIMVRFLFIFIDELESIRTSQKSRNFDIHSSITPYKWRVKQVGYTIGMMFLKAYEKGETTFFSMMARCYSDKSDLYKVRQSIGRSEYLYIGVLIVLIVVVQIVLFTRSSHIGILGTVLYTR
ncbi:cobalt ECF transporter T component CbiQ [Methanobrevibacter sp. 87.7]|uniref:cobalt ECF transporter T component CbiQ n=1 Tax=Methanobrevibacter sp. 87.7 TaxID=387957 RepID=UPI000B507434|nr:cobalt ECF transporter T component CbiQ [Methanobrevibacter sp. 87.7]OWT33359.1 cobalt ECF transporter T component CbiQ [Methanobrevibacter sp. 87.7]